MANNIPFQEMGKTVRILSSSTANTVAVTADSPCNQVRIHNGTATDVFIRLSTSSDANAAIPLANTPAYGMALHNNSTHVFTAPRVANVEGGYTFYVSVISSANANVFVTPGEGL